MGNNCCCRITETPESEEALPLVGAPAEELSLYKAACRSDSKLRTFDTMLQCRTSRFLSTLVMGVEEGSLSLDSLRMVSYCLLDTNQDVADVILNLKKDIWKSLELFDLVKDYLESSLRTLDLFTALDKCLKRARDSHQPLHAALQRFNDEEDADAGARYARTLHELRQFKAAGDPFTDEFFAAFQVVYQQQQTMLKKLEQRKHLLDKKVKTIKAWRRVSNIIFATTYATVLICSVVAAAIAVPPAAALAAAAAVPMESMRKWIDSLLKEYQDAFRGQKEVVTFFGIHDLKIIRVLIDEVKVEMSSMVGCVEFAEREAVKFEVEEIKKKLENFMKSVDDLGEQTDRCRQTILLANKIVVQGLDFPGPLSDTVQLLHPIY